jgi:hypothetical protein
VDRRASPASMPHPAPRPRTAVCWSVKRWRRCARPPGCARAQIAWCCARATRAVPAPSPAAVSCRPSVGGPAFRAARPAWSPAADATPERDPGPGASLGARHELEQIARLLLTASPLARSFRAFGRRTGGFGERRSALQRQVVALLRCRSIHRLDSSPLCPLTPLPRPPGSFVLIGGSSRCSSSRS